MRGWKQDYFAGSHSCVNRNNTSQKIHVHQDIRPSGKSDEFRWTLTWSGLCWIFSVGLVLFCACWLCLEIENTLKHSIQDHRQTDCCEHPRLEDVLLKAKLSINDSWAGLQPVRQTPSIDQFTAMLKAVPFATTRPNHVRLLRLISIWEAWIPCFTASARLC